MVALTGVIITRNEERHIAAAIASLACCDEILVVDSESTDRTREIAEKCGARVLLHPWEGYAAQKNFAAAAAAHHWILSLDADERVSAELAAELYDWKRSTPSATAGSMPRRVFYLGAWIRHSGWYPDRKIRLYRRDQARWEGDFVHERLVTTGTIHQFSGDILHFPYPSWNDHMQRIERYTHLAAKAAKENRRRGNPVRLLLGPPLEFLRTLVFRGGILDGWRGAR